MDKKLNQPNLSFISRLKSPWIAISSIVIILLVFLSSIFFFRFNNGVSGFNTSLLYDSTKNTIIERINDEYIGQLPTQDQIREGQIKGIVNSLDDPYSEYLSAEEMKLFRESLNEEYQGVGIKFNKVDGLYTITGIISKSPAQEAGLKAGDIITHVNGEDTMSLSIEEVTSKIKGKSGTEVTLRILSQDKSNDITITRRQIKNDLAILEIKDTIAIISISSFGEGLTSQMRIISEEIISNKNVKSIILDLRNNTGGILGESINVASFFLEENSLVVKEVSKDDEIEERSKNINPSLKDYEVVVLVNEYSASASEIVAAALRDNKGTLLIGRRTFGKGVVQKLFPLPDGGTLKLTIAEWFTPNGEKIHEKGLEPSISVESDDEVVSVAMEYLK